MIYGPFLNIRSPRHKHWPAGPAHFSDRRASLGQYIWSFTGPYEPPRYMSGHQISIVLARTMTNYSMYFSRGRPSHISAVFAQFFCYVQRDASVSRVGMGHVNQTHWRQCLDHGARDTSMRTSGTHPGTFLREAHGMVPSKQFCVLPSSGRLIWNIDW